MKLALIAGLAFAGLMDEAEAGTSAGGAAQQQGPTLEKAIADAASKMQPGGEYHDRADYVVGGISGHYKADPEEVRKKLLVAIEAEAAKAAEEATPKADTAPNVADTSGDTDHQPAGAHLDAPAAKPVEGEAVAQVAPEKTDDEYANALADGKPRVALVGKYADRIPVQIKSAGHLEQLKAEHGAGMVEVVS